MTEPTKWQKQLSKSEFKATDCNLDYFYFKPGAVLVGELFKILAR